MSTSRLRQTSRDSRSGSAIPVFILASLLLLPPLAFGAAELGDNLARRWAVATPSEFIPVLVVMRDRVDLDRDLPQLVHGQPSLAARHALALQTLKQRSEQTQTELRGNLETARLQARARSVHHYWIDNLIGLEATPSLLAELADRDDVERLILLPEVVIDPPVYGTVAVAPAGRESGLDSIGAPTMWAMGITGKGRVVCGIDTGVRGTHFGLAERWRGLNVPWQEAWYDPRGLTSFPEDIGNNPANHGSHTMGTICGADTVRGDTVGVAPDAEWIAAFGIGSSALNTLDLIDCMQWTADPDGNFNTTADVPDVLNCSWRFSVLGIVYPCNDILDGAIASLEAAGVVVIWAAGNEGSGASTIGYPANATNPYSTNFAVGNYNPAAGEIVGSSSRGPTPCIGDTIKPEVVAPGANIRSCYRNNDSLYGTLTGTSMASPHVAGAAALLRQLAPQATPAQIKQALFVSAIDKGTPGEDNTYGRGLIDIPAAAESLSVIMGGPDLRVSEELISVSSGGALQSSPAGGGGDSLTAGDTVSLTFHLENRSENAAVSAYLRLTTTSPYVTLIDDSVFVGIVLGGDTITPAEPLRFVVDVSTPEGQPLPCELNLFATGYTSTRSLQYFTDPPPFPENYTHDNTLVEFTVSNYGLYGLGDQSYYPLGGAGFLYGPSVVNQLAEGALMLGLSANQVSDAARRSGGADRGFQVTDHDFAVSPGGALRMVPNIDGAFQTTRCVFDDAAAENPIGIRVTQHSLIFPIGSEQGYVMLVYTLENISAGPVVGLYAGMMHDCDYPAFLAGADTTGFDAATQMGYMFDVTKIASGPYRGVSVLSNEGATAFRAINAQGELYSTSTGEVLATDSLKWDYLSGGVGAPAVPTGSYGDAATVVGTGPFDILAGDTVQVAFAYVGSEDGLARLQQNAAAAKVTYDDLHVTSVGDDETHLPRQFTLHQNYPNPFNPATRISFSVAQAGHVSLTVYNLLGERVQTLWNAIASPGEYAVNWDGTDVVGSRVASGVYFYRLDLDGAASTRKMLLLR